MALKRVNPGQAVSAAEWNKLCDLAESVQEDLRALKVIVDEVRSGQIFDRPLRGRISARFGVDADGTGLEPGISYTVVAKDLRDPILNVVPTYGRPMRANGAMVPRLVAAQVDDVCWIVRRRGEDGAPDTSEYWISTEALAGAVCADGVAPGIAGKVLQERARERSVASTPGLTSAGGGSSAAGGASGTPG